MHGEPEGYEMTKPKFILWSTVMTSCSLVGGYQYFGCTTESFFRVEYVGNMFLPNFCTHLLTLDGVSLGLD